MKRWPLPEPLRNGWIGPVCATRAERRRRGDARARLGVIHDLVKAGCYIADAGGIARSVLAAVASNRRH